MAATHRMLRLLLIILTVINFADNSAEVIDWQITTRRYVNDLAKALVKLMNRTSDINHLQMIYGDLTGAELKQVSKNHLLKKMAKDIGALYGERMAALRKLVERAEHAVINHKFNLKHQISDDPYENVKNVNDDDLKYNFIFKSKVDPSTSAVYIPEGMLENDPIVQNEITWSSVLDKTFKRNHELYSGLSWQYFTSQTGIMRIYPATKWPDETVSDPFNVYKRSWYIEALTSSKDMLVLIDTSAIARDKNLYILKMAIKSLLYTLGENDFVNIAQFKDTVEWISCINKFVQANSVNKQIFIEAVDKLEGKDEEASYSNALKFALLEFKKLNNTKKFSGSGCQKIIMLFTYGNNKDALNRAYLDAINQTSINIVIYGLGNKLDICNSIDIPSADKIQDKLQQYLNDLSTPMVLAGGKQFEWTYAYSDFMGLGMISTIKAPVYNRSEVGHSLMGVMGIDIPIEELKHLSPIKQLGPLGYSFAINHNGFVIFHPNMRIQKNYFDDPLRTDLLDLEEDSDLMNELRRKMIDKLPSFITSKRLETMPNQQYVQVYEKSYFFTGVANTPMSIGLVFPTDRNYYLSVDSSRFNVLAAMGNQKNNLIMAPWPYCDGYPDEPNANLFKFIRSGRNCNKEMLMHLLWDIQKTKSIPHTWNTTLDRNPLFSDCVKAIFFGTEGGLTRIFPDTDLFVKKFQQYSDTWNADYYRRAFLAKDIWVFSAITEPGSHGNDSQVIIQAVRSVISKEKKLFIPGVVGVQFEMEALVELFLEGNFEDLGFSAVEFPNYDIDHLPCNQKEVVCYLVDDGGFVIGLSQYTEVENVNKFLGDVDPELMWVLLENHVYDRKKTLNYQALCPVLKNDIKQQIKDAPAAASRISFLSALVHWLLDLLSLIYLKFNFWSFYKFWWLPPTAADIDFVFIDDFEPCVTEQYQYYYGENDTYFGDFSCNACYRKVSAMRMQETNLLFVVIDVPCSVSGLICSDILRVHQKPERVPSETLCQIPTRYRKKPTECYSHDNRETVDKCSPGPET